MLKWIKLLFLLAILVTAIVLGMLFTSQNTIVVAPVLWGYALPQWSVGLWMVIALFTGALMGLLISLIPLLFNRYSRSNKDKKILQLQKELAKLRLSGVKG